MHIQKSNSEGSIPIAYIRCKIDSNGIVEYIASANKEASSLMGYNIEEHLDTPILDLYPHFSKTLPWHPIFLLPSTHTLLLLKNSLRHIVKNTTLLLSWSVQLKMKLYFL